MTLVELYNRGYEYARQVDDGYVGSTRKGATHALACTSWVSNKTLSTDVRKAIREAKTRPVGPALSVCAIPLKKPRKRVCHHKFKRHLTSKAMLAYAPHGGLFGKRSVLVELARLAHRAPVKMKKIIKRLSSSQCDALYRQFLLANAHHR